jgi:predicted RNase H-like HicB family nuclease
MKSGNFHSVIWKEDNWFVARCVEVNVASQGKNRKEAVANLREALELYFEDSRYQLPEIEEVQLQEVSVN